MRLSKSGRRAAVTLEFILCLPVLLILLTAAVQYGTAMVVRQAIAHAAADGAREAGKGGSAADIIAAINAVLATHQLSVNNAPGSGLRVEFEDELSPSQSFGDLTVNCNPPASPLMAGEARVTVCLDLTTAPLSNWLSYYGVNFAGRRFEISSLVRKE